MDTMAFYLGAFGCNSRLLKMTNIMKGADMDIVAESWYFGVMGGHHGRRALLFPSAVLHGPLLEVP